MMRSPVELDLEAAVPRKQTPHFHKFIELGAELAVTYDAEEYARQLAEGV